MRVAAAENRERIDVFEAHKLRRGEFERAAAAWAELPIDVGALHEHARGNVVRRARVVSNFDGRIRVKPCEFNPCVRTGDTDAPIVAELARNRKRRRGSILVVVLVDAIAVEGRHAEGVVGFEEVRLEEVEAEARHLVAGCDRHRELLARAAECAAGEEFIKGFRRISDIEIALRNAELAEDA